MPINAELKIETIICSNCGYNAHSAAWHRTLLTFMLPVPGAAVLLTSSVIHAVQDDQNKGDQL